MQTRRILLLSVKAVLFATALTPLVYVPAILFPFVFGKMLFYRALTALALALALVILLFFSDVRERARGAFKSLFRNPLFLFVLLFIVSAGVSTLLAPSPYRAFWGDIERGEGFLGLLHYFVFLLLALLLFEKKDWRLFFWISLGAGGLVALYAWLQYFGVAQWPLRLPTTTQPGSFTGNPAYLSGYLIILAAFGAFLLREAFSAGRRASLTFLLVFLGATVFLTAIRGAILGVFAGALFLGGYWLLRGGNLSLFSFSARRRPFAAGLLVFLLLFAAAFWTTRTHPVWQSIPGLQRFAKASFDIPSVTTRIIALGVSWDAFKERPLFGWGPENYNVAYNAHYDPAYSYYAEDWFDRAHNKVAEVAVMQGIVGIILYLGIFALLFFPPVTPFLGAVLVAYFVQNLFLFDNVISYIPFFGVIGYVLAEGQRNGADAQANTAGEERTRRPSAVLLAAGGIGALAVAAGLFLFLYHLTYVPFRQGVAYVEAVRLRVGDKILALTDRFLIPYNFAQTTIRGQFADFLNNNELFRPKEFFPLTDKALAALEESVAREPQEPRNFIRLVEAYNERAKDDDAVFKRSEDFSRKALALSPRRQGLWYHLAFVLTGEKRYEEAFAGMRETIASDPRVGKAHYQFGLILAIAAADEEGIPDVALRDRYRREAEDALTKALALGAENEYQFYAASDLQNLFTIYNSWKDYGAYLRVIDIAITRFPKNPDYYKDGIVVARHLRDKNRIIRYAEMLAQVDPSLADDMEVIVDLARKENWEILDTL